MIPFGSQLVCFVCFVDKKLYYCLHVIAALYYRHFYQPRCITRNVYYIGYWKVQVMWTAVLPLDVAKSRMQA